MHILLKTVMTGRPGRTEAETLRGIVQTQIGSLTLGPDKRLFPVIEKPGRFGLRRVGLQADLPARNQIRFDDFYFRPRDPQQPFSAETCEEYDASRDVLPNMSDTRMCREYTEAADFAVCSVDAVPDRGEVPNFPGVARCEQWFAVPELSAVAQASYERRHLQDWAAIKERSRALLSKFKR